MSELSEAKDAAAMALKAMQGQARVEALIRQDDLDPGPLRNLGNIHLEPQPLTDWNAREDHAPATIQMDSRGRDRLIAALIAGNESIEVYGASGGGYTLNLEVE